MTRIPVTNEIAIALLDSEISEYEKSLLEANPKNFLFTLLKMDFADATEVKVLKNNAKMIHLSLPYYGAEDLVARAVSDDDLEHTIGGVATNIVQDTIMTERGAEGFVIANRQFSDDDINDNQNLK